jgi:hypothetical protein
LSPRSKFFASLTQMSDAFVNRSPAYLNRE